MRATRFDEPRGATATWRLDPAIQDRQRHRVSRFRGAFKRLREGGGPERRKEGSTAARDCQELQSTTQLPGQPNRLCMERSSGQDGFGDDDSKLQKTSRHGNGGQTARGHLIGSIF